VTKKIILGTRGSELARAQARLVEKAIQAARPDTGIETRVITTQGDKARLLERQAGRKGLFTAEIERALVAREIDLAVHSAKDLPSEMNPDAEIAAVLPRAPVDDVLVSKHSRGGIIAIQVRVNDQSTKAIADLVNDRETLLCLRAEREFLRLLQGDCNCPVGVLATINNETMKLRGQLFGDGSAAPQEAEVEGMSNDGQLLALQLLNILPA
jgi:porphobilinogen deaminase